MTNQWPYQVPERLPQEPARDYLARCLSVWGARAALARAIPCQPGIVAMYCTGQLVPKLTAGAAIERLLGIPASEWERPQEPLWAKVEWQGGPPAPVLRAALVKRGAQAAMARASGLTPLQMSHVCAGRREPTIAQARVFEREVGIPWTAWFDAAAARPALEREAWRVEGAARLALLAWADQWDRWGMSTKSWQRLGMSDERFRSVLEGAEPTERERERAKAVAEIAPESWE